MTKITQLAAGDLSATSTDAVNGSQLYATNQNVTQNTSDISGLDTRVTINESELETNTNDIAVLDARVSDHDSARSEEHTSELQSLMRISYAVFCLKKKT